jgi:DNA-binding NarL/FixJ family response regulator
MTRDISKTREDHLTLGADASSSMPWNVFVVDDNPLVRDVIREVFEKRSDFRVCGEAENGQQAIQNAKRLSPSPDLVILDLSMPDMNGLDAARALKSLMPGVPVILFTAYIDVPEEDLRAAGISAQVSKAEPVEVLTGVARGLLGENAAA